MTQPKRRTVLITGGSSGIGLEFAKVFAEQQWNLILVASNNERLISVQKALTAIHGVRVSTIAANLATREGAEYVHEEVSKLGLDIDALINNAGVGMYGSFQDIDAEKNEEMILLNTYTMTALTKAFLPKLLKKDKTYIVNISSTASFFPGPYMAVYFATKAFVTSFSQALNHELRYSNISVTTICPGPTQTNFAQRSGALLTELFQGSTLLPREVALIGYRAMLKKKRLVIIGAKNKLLVFLSRFLPQSWLIIATSLKMKKTMRMRMKMIK